MRLVDLFATPSDLIAALDDHAILVDKAQTEGGRAVDELAKYV